MKKNLAKLVPTKKHVVRTTKLGTPSDADITYYVKPHEAKKGKTKLRSTNDVENKRKFMNGLKSYDDFKKIGVDPEAAKLFFCRM